ERGDPQDDEYVATHVRGQDNPCGLTAPAGVEGGRVPHPPPGNVRVASKRPFVDNRCHARCRAGSLAAMRRLALVSASLIALALAPAPALAASRDVSTTATYVRANYALVSSAHAKIHTAEAILQ